MQIWSKAAALVAPAILVALWPAASGAHVKWFIETPVREQLLAASKPEIFSQWGALNSGLVVLAAVVVAGVIAAAALPAVGRRAERIGERLGFLEGWAATAVGVLTGLSLIISASQGHFIALNLRLGEAGAGWLAVPEAVLGGLLVLGLLTRLAAFAMLACFAAAFALFPASDAMDLIVVPGLALYLMAYGRGNFALDKLLREPLAGLTRPVAGLGLPALRMLAGIELVVLGLTEKLLNPQLSLQFLEDKSWLNFMAGAGLPFPDDLFVLCAGLVEVAVGLLLLAGAFPRVLVVVVAVLFAITFTTIGVPELYGHLAYVGAALAIFIQGGGSFGLPSWLRGLFGGRPDLAEPAGSPSLAS